MSARYKLERDASRLCAHHGPDVLLRVVAILGTVRGVELVMGLAIGFGYVNEGDVLVDTASLYVSLVAVLRAAEPCCLVPIRGADIDIVAHTHNPDCARLS